MAQQVRIGVLAAGIGTVGRCPETDLIQSGPIAVVRSPQLVRHEAMMPQVPGLPMVSGTAELAALDNGSSRHGERDEGSASLGDAGASSPENVSEKTTPWRVR